MASYTGMTLGGEVRESISLDEDDMSDVEDEVFIRDGKNSYKLAEELNVKRPLMAPRRKHGKTDTSSRLIKNKHTCRRFCRPCCYFFIGLSIIVGLTLLVIVLVSIYPLPLDKLRDYILSRSRTANKPIKVLPCSNLKVTDVWTTNLPKLTSESPVKTLDVNLDGVSDVLFGFGTGGNYHTLPPDIFCPIYMGVPPPCEGGVIALNGIDGNILWRHWINDTIFFLQCTADIDIDGLNDCLAIGSEGTITVINAKNGSTIWGMNNNKEDVYLGSFIPDQNNDKVPDILASHSSRTSRNGHLLFLSGKTGEIIKEVSTPNGDRTYFMPQLFTGNNGSYFILFGTGTPNTPGSLMVSSLENLISGNMTTTYLYHDEFKGMLTQGIFVDITGDEVDDIIVGMFNSTTVAFDGSTLEQIWNFTIPNSETTVLPTPAYFDDDNITDFLVIYEKYDNILNYNYTEAYIINGKTGKPFNEKPISGSIRSQLGGVTLSMEPYGFDMLLYWTVQCATIDMYKKHYTLESGNFFDYCQRFNTSSIINLNALSQCNEPPGIEVYSSLNRAQIEFNNAKTPLKELMDYIQNHPNFEMPTHRGQAEIDEDGIDYNKEIKMRKYGDSSFRHKASNPGIVKDYMGRNNEEGEPVIGEGGMDYDILNGFPDERSSQIFPGYSAEANENPPLYNDKPIFSNENSKQSNRDPRSRSPELNKNVTALNDTQSSTIKKNLSDEKFGIYGYKTVRLAKNRLLHDLKQLPTDILKDTYFKNRESQLRKSKFEQRDINVHKDKSRDNAEVHRIIEDEKNLSENLSTTLWDLEGDKETQEKEDGYYRQKRQVDTFHITRSITSSGAVLPSFNTKNNSIDIIFVTYWQPLVNNARQNNIEIKNCIEEKLSKDKDNTYQKTTIDEQKALFERECTNELENLKNEFDYYNEINQLSLGQMTVYRLRLECKCDSESVGEQCAKFLPAKQQSWPSYLGRNDDGVYRRRT